MIFMILHVDLALTPTFLEAICRAAPDSAPSGCAGAAMSMIANMTYINTAQTFHVGLVARNLHTPMFESELRKQSVVINSGRACDESSVVRLVLSTVFWAVDGSLDINILEDLQ